MAMFRVLLLAATLVSVACTGVLEDGPGPQPTGSGMPDLETYAVRTVVLWIVSGGDRKSVV